MRVDQAFGYHFAGKVARILRENIDQLPPLADPRRLRRSVDILQCSGKAIVYTQQASSERKGFGPVYR